MSLRTELERYHCIGEIQRLHMPTLERAVNCCEWLMRPITVAVAENCRYLRQTEDDGSRSTCRLLVINESEATTQ